MNASVANVGTVLRPRRKELGWTVEFAEQSCDANLRTIGELEHSLRQLGYGTFATYAQNMGIDIAFTIPG